MQDCCFSFKKKTAINAGPVKNENVREFQNLLLFKKNTGMSIKRNLRYYSDYLLLQNNNKI